MNTLTEINNNGLIVLGLVNVVAVIDTRLDPTMSIISIVVGCLNAYVSFRLESYAVTFLMICLIIRNIIIIDRFFGKQN